MPDSNQPAKSKSSKTGGLVKVILINILITLLLLEIASAILIETGTIEARKPPYSMKNSIQSFWGDINEHFGVWHPSNMKFRHIRNCYDITYASNSYGARDIERSYRSKAPRVIVLGDSFIEGPGVEMQDRISEQLEEKSGQEHLNFGTSGNFGPVQEYLLYKYLARDFDHQSIILGILPDNDFYDMSLKGKENRYFPYWTGTYPDYQLTYSLDSIEESSWSQSAQDNKTIFKYFLLNFTYLRNLYDYLGALLDNRKIREEAVKTKKYEEESPFAEYEEEEFMKMVYSYERLIREAGGRNLFLFTIPRMRDLQWYKENGTSPLGEALFAWSDQYPNVYFLDLLPIIAREIPQEKWSELFISCDRHWSEKGHELGAELLFENFGKILY